MDGKGDEALQLYEVALAQGETSRDLMARARRMGMGHVTATTDLSDEQVRRLYPHRHLGGPAKGPVVVASRPSSTAIPEPAADAGRGSPSMGTVALAVVIALVALATGMAVIGGDSDRHDGPQKATATRPTEAAADGAPLQVVDPAALCTGWPSVLAYWDRFALELDTADDAEALTAWAEANHRGAAMALRDDVEPALGGDDAGPEVQDVLRWVFDTAYATEPRDLDEIRAVTEAAAPAVATLHRAATSAC